MNSVPFAKIAQNLVNNNSFFLLQGTVLPARKGQGFPEEEIDFICDKFATEIVYGVQLKVIQQIVANDESLTKYLEKKCPTLDRKSQVIRVRDILRLYMKKQKILAKAKKYLKPA